MAEPRSLPSDAVERLLAAANGDAALLYLHFAAGRPLENAREALRRRSATYTQTEFSPGCGSLCTALLCADCCQSLCCGSRGGC